MKKLLATICAGTVLGLMASCDDAPGKAKAYNQGINIIPTDNPRLKSDFYGQIGDIYYQMKQMDQTYKAYDEALKYNDNNIVVLNNYA